MKKRVLSFFMVIAIILGTIALPNASNVKIANAATFDDLNQSQIVEAMGAGWNLGNQLEASSNGTPSETAWGNPTITQSMIQSIANAGFKSIRIPASWLSYIGGAPNYTINSTWMNRVKQVVDYAINSGLYVIINVHGDGYGSVTGGWLLPGSSDQTTIKAKYEKVWTQIATTFATYDEHLIFESMNEIGADTWDNATIKAYYTNINAYNQIFVNSVRATGGNNAKRWVLIPGWNTNIDKTAIGSDFVIPSDTSCTASGKRIMISVHYYSPWEFCGQEDNVVTQWGNNANSSKIATWGDEAYLTAQFKSMYDKFGSQGYPTVIGEYGSIDKSAGDSANPTYRAYFAKRVCETAKQYGCVPVIWDNGYNGNYGFGLFDRSTGAITQAGIINAIMGVFSNSLAGTYYIKNVNSNLYMEVAGASTTNGALIQQYSNTNNNCQKFKLVSAGNGYYYLYTGSSGYTKVVDIKSKSTANGASIIQYTYSGATNQQFEIVQVSSGKYAIKTRITGSASAFDDYGWSSALGTPVVQWSYAGGNNQLWYLESTN